MAHIFSHVSLGSESARIGQAVEAAFERNWVRQNFPLSPLNPITMIITLRRKVLG